MYVPAGHTPPFEFATHVAQPVAAALTAVHALVVAPACDHVPVGHEPEPATELAPVKQYLPAAQGMHVSAPDAEYVPAGHEPPVAVEHDVQPVAVVSDAVEPTVQAATVAPPVEYVPALHAIGCAVPPVQ